MTSATYRESEAHPSNRKPLPIPAPGIGSRIGLAADRLKRRTTAAKAMGVSADALQRYIREENEPPFGALARLCGAAGVRLEWLASGEGPMLAAETAPLSQSQVARLDPEMIRSAVKLLGWAFELQGGVYDPAKDPDLLADTYAFLAEHGGSVTPDNLVDFSKRLAAKRAEEERRAKQGAGGKAAGGGNS